MGHRLILRGVDPYSLAMARSFRRGSAPDARSPHETVCGRAIGVRSFTYLWGVHCGFPKCGITTFECAMLEIVSSTGQGRNAKCSQGAGYEGKRIGGGGWTRTNDLRIMSCPPGTDSTQLQQDSSADSGKVLQNPHPPRNQSSAVPSPQLPNDGDQTSPAPSKTTTKDSGESR